MKQLLTAYAEFARQLDESHAWSAFGIILCNDIPNMAQSTDNKLKKRGWQNPSQNKSMLLGRLLPSKEVDIYNDENKRVRRK